ncbi:uncharacterized protein ARMOST_18658 [Armillaria ostoyae]|uniref:Uncharacterized protein n=1 Tax=Armillaria ostoyae TaxID=47428 RepID=A0A284S2D6_ARMOS|nr:uncharacterized protein ARMOST_18658 [Armillaria ostoyae]
MAVPRIWGPLKKFSVLSKTGDYHASLDLSLANTRNSTGTPPATQERWLRPSQLCAVVRCRLISDISKDVGVTMTGWMRITDSDASMRANDHREIFALPNAAEDTQTSPSSSIVRS